MKTRNDVRWATAFAVIACAACGIATGCSGSTSGGPSADAAGEDGSGDAAGSEDGSAADAPAGDSGDAASSGNGGGDTSADATDATVAPDGSSSPDGPATPDGAPNADAQGDGTAIDAPEPGDGSADAASADAGPDSDTFAACGFATGQPQCAQVCNGAPLVQPSFSGGTPPTPAGGALTPGTYALTSETYYVDDDAQVDAGAPTIRLTAVVSDTGIQLVQSDDGAPNTTAALTYTPGDASLALSLTCPAPADVSVGYTATSGTLDLQVPQAGGTDGAYLVDEHFDLVTPADAGSSSSD